MEESVLKKLQAVLTDILAVVDKFCKEHDIPYSVYGGTMIGAVRHKGFIPWDDDIDICMERGVYERFLRLWRENPIDGYYIAGDDEVGCLINHTKILKCGTVLSNKADLEKPIPHEIWVDVFAIDKIPTDPKKRKKFMRSAKLRLVYTRNMPYAGGGLLLNVASRLLLAKTKKHKQKLKEKYTRDVTRYKDATENFEYIDLSCTDSLRCVYEPNVFDGMHETEFNGLSVSISDHADHMLKAYYGDYMTLPPESERVCRHNPEVIDFGDGITG